MRTEYSPKIKKVISFSREEALRLNHDQIGIEHLLLGLIREGEGLATKVLKSLDIDLILLRRKLESAVRDKISAMPVNSVSLPLTKQAEKVLMKIVSEAQLMKSNLIGTQHLMLAILKDEDNIGTKILNKMNIDDRVFKAKLENILQENQLDTDIDAD